MGIWTLAIRKLEIEGTPLFKLLLIDDVLHSVDAEHRTRLAQLLKSHFADHQIVLVTHDKNFYERLKATLGGGYKYLAISSWDIDIGPHLSDPSTDLCYQSCDTGREISRRACRCWWPLF